MELSFQRKEVGKPFFSQRLFILIFSGLITLTGPFRGQAQNPIVVQTVAGLRTLNTTGYANDTVAYVIDYYPLAASAHRGGGNFRWITPRSLLGLCCGATTADDGGRFITNSVNTNGVWERVFDGGMPNVKMWGAYGDGVHDDTIAIQRALDGTRDWSGAGELLFPGGTYMITNTLIFNSTLTHVTGEGPLNTFVMMKLGYSADIFHTWNAHLFLTGVGDPNADFDHGLIFENIGLTFQDDGNIQSGHPVRNKTNSGLVLGIPGEVSTIRNVHIQNGGVGIRCLSGGAPGLNLRDVRCFEPAIAGILIQPLPGETNVDGGGPITIIGLSGDQNYGDTAATASLVVVSNVDCLISISSVKAESDWGGGLIHYYCGNAQNNGAHLSLRECNFNAGETIDHQFYQPDFLKIEPSSTFNTTFGFGPVVTIEQVKFNGVLNLIHDLIGNRIVEADTQGWWGLDQLAANLPITYQASTTGGGVPTAQATGSTLMIGETAFTTFYPTNTGWYRIMVPFGNGINELSGRISITSPYSKENIELQVDCTDWTTPWLNVTRCKTGMHVISQARAINYFDSTIGGEWNFLDVFVTNALPASAQGHANRLTIALDTAGMSPLNHVQAQLLSPVIKVSDTPPTGASVTTVNTYR
jgi:hypothetical protein